MGGVLTRLIVTYAYICFSNRSTKSHLLASPLLECSPTIVPLTRDNPKLRHHILCPIIIDALSLDQ